MGGRGTNDLSGKVSTNAIIYKHLFRAEYFFENKYATTIATRVSIDFDYRASLIPKQKKNGVDYSSRSGPVSVYK